MTILQAPTGFVDGIQHGIQLLHALRQLVLNAFNAGGFALFLCACLLAWRSARRIMRGH